MFLKEALHQLIEAPAAAYITRPKMDGAGVYYVTADEALRFRRFPNSHGWDWTPTSVDLLSRMWTVVQPPEAR